jgi:hypothetical protein
MPTDLVVGSAAKRKTRSQTIADITILSGWLIICLINLVFLFADPALPRALEAIGQYSTASRLIVDDVMSNAFEI